MADNLTTWIRRISDQELPIFKYTVNAITDVVASEDTSTAQLSQIILNDASLTARILRLANSTLYNPGSSPINTVSRAILFIGFDKVRDICLSLAVIDALLGEKAKEHELKLMAKSFHAAVQAQAIAEKRGDNSPEEIFIAALLYHLGEISFWCITDEEGKKIIELMEKHGFKPDMAQKEVLGFTFDQLTLGLTQDWHLSNLLHSTINNPGLADSRIRDIIYSHQLAEHATDSWESQDAQRVIQQIAQHLKIKPEQTKEFLCTTANYATKVAQLFGASSIIKYLPIPLSEDQESEENEVVTTEFPQPDPYLQLTILRDLSGMLEARPNLILMLEVILEGIYRGIGMDRALFALISPDKKNIIGKYALGKDNESFTRKFNFDIADNKLFNKIFAHGRPLWIKDSQAKDYAELVNPGMHSILASKAFFICPIVVNRCPIGVFYSDRQPSNRELDSESYESFKHFCLQASLAIEHVTPRKHRP